jgi:hypothetical protein
MYVRTWQKEFLRFVLFDKFNQIGEILFTMKYFPLPVLDIFLQVIGCGFRDAEIFHAIRDFNPHLFANPEKMIYCITGSKDYGRAIQDIYSVLTKFFCRYTFYLEEFPERNVYIELFNQVPVR